MPRTAFKTAARGLDRQHPALRLYEKAKRFGGWNPSDLDFAQDRSHWRQLSSDEQDLLLRLTALFQAGEEAVTLDLLPLIQVIAAEGRIEEEIYLASFLYEEAKHVDFFSRFLEEVAGASGDLSHFHSQNFRTIFYEALPDALDALRQDRSVTAQVRAAITYNMVVEGVLAETGYYGYDQVLNKAGLSAAQIGINHVRQDESRHIAFGVYLLSRLVAEHPDSWEVLEEQMNLLLVPAIGVIADIFACYDPIPFGLVEDDFVNFAVRHFTKRMERLERARGASLEEVYRWTRSVIETNESD
jgi:ribonucleoside-diphosphate reductase beta chain